MFGSQFMQTKTTLKLSVNNKQVRQYVVHSFIHHCSNFGQHMRVCARLQLQKYDQITQCPSQNYVLSSNFTVARGKRSRLVQQTHFSFNNIFSANCAVQACEWQGRKTSQHPCQLLHVLTPAFVASVDPSTSWYGCIKQGMQCRLSKKYRDYQNEPKSMTPC